MLHANHHSHSMMTADFGCCSIPRSNSAKRVTAKLSCAASVAPRPPASDSMPPPQNQARPARADSPLTLQGWRAAQVAGGGLARLKRLVAVQRETMSSTHAWITLASPDLLQQQWYHLQELRSQGNSLPLYGVPFAAKDNIDVIGLPTTAACPAYAQGPASSDAPVVAKLKAAGAIVVGKTNMDQFATGLVGTRSPHGAVPNAFDDTRISGGSSSGSAFVVSKGIVPFSLGTDTAGSGRVPASLNNVVGLKPTRGALSARKVIPACRTLDCVSIFALIIEDAEVLVSIAEGYDVLDSYSRQRPDPSWTSSALRFDLPSLGKRPSLAICGNPRWYGEEHHPPAYEAALDRARDLGWDLAPVDFAPLFTMATFLYEGPWVTERYASLKAFVDNGGEEQMDPVVRSIVCRSRKILASDYFTSEYERQDLARHIQLAFGDFDGILVPTNPTIPTMEQVAADPLGENNLMGTYTNWVNFMDWSALSIPAGFRSDGLPLGLTLVSGKWQEAKLMTLARQWFQGERRVLGATGVTAEEAHYDEALLSTPTPPTDRTADTFPIAVAGAHLSGQPLNGELTRRGATLEQKTTTLGAYRLYVVPTASASALGPRRSGLMRALPGEAGREIAVEVWALPHASLASFVAAMPAGLALGTVELRDGRTVHGFVCEPAGLVGATDVTEYGGWKAYAEQHVGSAACINEGRN